MNDPNVPESTSRIAAQGASTTAYVQGKRLYCKACHAEIEIVNPCPCEPPDQRFQCCGEAMIPMVGASVHLNVVS